MPIATTNPATGETLRSFEPMPAGQIEDKLRQAAIGFEVLRATTFARRAEWMRVLADILDDECGSVASLITTEMGKTVAAAEAEVDKSARACWYFADRAHALLADKPADTAAVGAIQAYVCYQPIGPVLAVMPWNFPLWQVIRFAAPALMAGNAGLLKHASNVPQTALYLEDLFRRAGFPAGAFQTLLINADQVQRVVADPRVRAVTLTGSEHAGRSVAAIAGRELKKTVLELGGSDPFVVMPSADVERAAAVGVASRCQNNGQSCIAAKRFIVHEDVYDEFAEAFTAKMSRLPVGDPMSPGTQIGPLATRQVRDDLAAQVDDAVLLGAQVLCGGEVPARPGWWYPPTVLAGLTPKMRVWTEEVFGPVAALYHAASYDEAVELANGTGFGLGANAWSNDPSEQEHFARDLDAGSVFLNGMTTSYPELPFGGIKRSGYGRELSTYGIREFCNIKTVWFGPAGQPAGAQPAAVPLVPHGLSG
jgi:succinate-semialdehyde dehydrogenase/glutarate-semialdehyde dehydrogenase